VARDREQYSGVHTRHEIDLIYYIGTVVGRVESESSVQQNAGRKGIYAIARRKNCICSTRDTKLACVGLGREVAKIGPSGLQRGQWYSIVEYIYRTDVRALRK
jgi:hypothetical protein